MLDEIVKKGGEGLILNRVDSMHYSGRSADLLKLKPWQDEEARVIKILPSKCKFSVMMAALLLKDKSSHILCIGTGFSDSEGRNPSQPGSVIT